MNLEDMQSKESLIQEFFTWLFDDKRIINKKIELNKEFDISLAPYYMDPNIYYPQQVADFFNTTAMKRLGRISQLSLAIDSFPNTYHNRLEHSKGAYNRKLEEMLYNFQNPDWKKYVEDNNLKLYIVGDLIKIAGHDIGHFPLSHAFEEEIYNTHEAHEIIGERIMCENEEIQNIYKSISPELPEIIKELYEKDIFNFNVHNEGSYDVDRMDYLSRDTLYLGLPERISTQMYKRVAVKCDENGKPIESDDFSITPDNNSITFIDVYDYNSLSQIEKLLDLRYKLYLNCYFSNRTKINECVIGCFLDALLRSNSSIGKDLKDFIRNLQSQDIHNADLSEFIKWDDIRLFENILSVAENHEDKNIRNLATMVIPTMESFLNLLYSHFNIHNTQEFNKHDKDFLKNIKRLITSDSNFAKNLRNPNFVFKNTVFNENEIQPSSDANISSFSYKLSAYKKKEPIYIRDRNGKIYELSRHPERKCDWDKKSTTVQMQCAYLPYLRFNGVPNEEIDRIRTDFSNTKSKSINRIDIKINSKVNMQPLQVGHSIEDTFLEL